MLDCMFASNCVWSLEDSVCVTCVSGSAAVNETGSAKAFRHVVQ